MPIQNVGTLLENMVVTLHEIGRNHITIRRLTMAKRTVVVPHIPCKKKPDTKVSYEELLAEFKRNADHIPAVVTAMKKADYDGWEQLIRDLANHIETNPKLKKFLRIKDVDGQEALSIGDPNWFFVGGVLAFAAGYALGTYCVKKGPCDFS